MSRAMGSLWVVACWAAALWCCGCAMLVSGACVTAGVGSCVNSRGSARFGVVAIGGRSLGVGSACGFVPGCGLGCGWFWALGWCVLCGVSGDGADGRGGVELACCGGAPVLVKCGVPCPWGFASWCVAVSLAGLSVEVSVSGGGGCGVVWLCWVLCVFPHAGGGAWCLVPWVGWLLLFGHRAVQGCHSRSPGLPSGVFRSVGRVGSLPRGAPGPPGRGAWDWIVAPRGPWSRCARVRAATSVGSAGRCVAVSQARGGPGAVPVGGEWLCVVGAYLLHGEGGGAWARAWCGPAAGHWVVAGAAASPWAGLPWCLPGASRGGPWLAGCGRFLWQAASMGVRLCVAGSPWGVQRAAVAWLVVVLPMGFAAVRRASSSVAPLGGLLLRCVAGGLGLGGSWNGSGAEAARVCGRCLHCVLRFSGLWCPGRVCPPPPSRFSSFFFPPRFLPPSFFFGRRPWLLARCCGVVREGGVCVGWGGRQCLRRLAWALVCAGVAVGVNVMAW